MPTARKTKSGTWRCQAFDHVEITPEGTKKYIHKSFTARTKYEAERLAREFMENRGKQSSDLTLNQAIDKYIEIKKNTLSPSTISGYRDIQRLYFGKLLKKRLSEITQEDLQAQINNLAADHKEKTCRNALGLFSAVMDAFIPDRHLRVKIPIHSEPEYYTPTDDDVRRILKEIRQSTLRKAVLLAAFGTMRRSEISGLKYSDIEGNLITIRRARVCDETGAIVVKDYPKNLSSHRTIEYPDFVIAEVLKGKKGDDDFIVPISPRSISLGFSRVRNRLGLPYFRFHDLRAYSVSAAHAIGIPDSYIMERGGWKTDGTLKRVYRRTMSDKSKEMSQKLNAHYTNIFAERGERSESGEKPEADDMGRGSQGGGDHPA